jgi:hypothetical protein
VELFPRIYVYTEGERKMRGSVHFTVGSHVEPAWNGSLSGSGSGSLERILERLRHTGIFDWLY